MTHNTNKYTYVRDVFGHGYTCFTLTQDLREIFAENEGVSFTLYLGDPRDAVVLWSSYRDVVTTCDDFVETVILREADHRGQLEQPSVDGILSRGFVCD